MERRIVRNAFLAAGLALAAAGASACSSDAESVRAAAGMFGLVAGAVVIWITALFMSAR